jgi:hypothetical protein
MLLIHPLLITLWHKFYPKNVLYICARKRFYESFERKKLISTNIFWKTWKWKLTVDLWVPRHSAKWHLAKRHPAFGSITFSLMLFTQMVFRKMTFRKMTFGCKTLSVLTSIKMALSRMPIDKNHNGSLFCLCHSRKSLSMACLFPERRFAECRGTKMWHSWDQDQCSLARLGISRMARSRMSSFTISPFWWKFHKTFFLRHRCNQLPATSYQLPAASYQLPATSYQLPATSYRLPAY